jgi:hypothetical protein
MPSGLWQPDRYGPPLPHPRRCDGNEGGRQVKAETINRAIVMTTRVASNDDGNGDGGKRWVNNNEGDGSGNNCVRQQ